MKPVDKYFYTCERCLGECKRAHSLLNHLIDDLELQKEQTELLKDIARKEMAEPWWKKLFAGY